MALTHSPSIVRSGLVLYLDAANSKSYPRSGTTWTDLSGNENNGTLTNGPTFNSANGGGFILDGTDDEITVANGNLFFSNKTQVTISVIFNISNNNRPNLINIPFNSGGIFSIEGPNTSNVLNTYFNNNNPTVFSYDLNKTYHLVSTFNNGQVQTYQNGLLIDTKTNTNSTILSASTSNLTIGRWKWVYTNSLSGNINIVKIYNRALSAAEIRQNFEATRDRYGI